MRVSTWSSSPGSRPCPTTSGSLSLSTAAVVLVGKFVAYTASLGQRLPGWPIFPAIALGRLLATMCSLIVDGTSVSALAATAIAAATAACMRLPFMATLLGVMLTYPAGGATTVTAIVGTIVGLLTRLAAEERAARDCARTSTDTSPGRTARPLAGRPAGPPGSRHPVGFVGVSSGMPPGGTCVCYPPVA